MHQLFIFFYLIAGTCFLYAGAEFLIRGGASLALRMSLPPLIIGLTIMGYGTGTPELVVSIQASLAEKGDIVVGNVLGSNIANIGLILGFTALCRPIQIQHQLARYDGLVMLLVSLALSFFLASSNEIGKVKGFFLFFGLIIHTLWTISLGRKEEDVKWELEEKGGRPLKGIVFDGVFIILGLLFLFFGGKLFLEGAVLVARRLELNDAVIGLTIVAIGTSLPEFAASFVALFRGHPGLALGNVVGSNIFNILGIIGLAAFIQPIHLVSINWIDYSYMTLLTLFLWGIIYWNKEITRWQGAVMLGSYFMYVCGIVFWG